MNEVLSIADYAYIVADKRIIAEGTPAELLSSQNPMVVQFLSGNADGPVRFHYPAKDYAEELFND